MEIDDSTSTLNMYSHPTIYIPSNEKSIHCERRLLAVWIMHVIWICPLYEKVGKEIVVQKDMNVQAAISLMDMDVGISGERNLFMNDQKWFISHWCMQLVFKKRDSNMASPLSSDC